MLCVFFCALLLLNIVLVTSFTIVCHHSLSRLYECHWVLISVFPGIGLFIPSLPQRPLPFLFIPRLPDCSHKNLSECSTTISLLQMKLQEKKGCEVTSHHTIHGSGDAFEDGGFYSKGNKKPNLAGSLCFLVSKTTTLKSPNYPIRPFDG